MNGNFFHRYISLSFKKSYIYLHIVQFIVSCRKMLEFLQHCQVPDIINVIVTDIQHTKRFLCKEFRSTEKKQFILQLIQNRILQINITLLTLKEKPHERRKRRRKPCTLPKITKYINMYLLWTHTLKENTTLQKNIFVRAFFLS